MNTARKNRMDVAKGVVFFTVEMKTWLIFFSHNNIFHVISNELIFRNCWLLWRVIKCRILLFFIKKIAIRKKLPNEWKAVIKYKV